MRRAVLAVLDWFIPKSATIEGAELGFARTFVFTHLFGPLLIQSIAVSVYMADPEPGPPIWAIMACISAFWTLPFVLRMTDDLRLTAAISVELLCVTSLLGTSFYGGVGSPFLPWLLVSLMLGFFYLSDRSLLVLMLFSGNVVATLVAHLLYTFPQHLSLPELRAVSWFSIFFATAYMSWMAIYYANIVTMSSELERETEKHRLLAQTLREAKRSADITSHGTSIFLAKMSEQLRTPLGTVIADSQTLLDGIRTDGTGAQRQTELEKINAAGRRLLNLVTDVLEAGTANPERVPLRVETFDLNGFAHKIGALAVPLLSPTGNRFALHAEPDLGIVRTDADKLRAAIVALVGNAARFTANGTVTVTVRRTRLPGDDRIEIEIRDTGIGMAPDMVRRLRTLGDPAVDDSGPSPRLATCSRLCAALRGALDIESEVGRGSAFRIRVPAVLRDAATLPRLAVAGETTIAAFGEG